MQKLKIGDKVKVRINRTCDNCEGRILTVIKTNDSDAYPITCTGGKRNDEIFTENALEIIISWRERICN